MPLNADGSYTTNDDEAILFDEHDEEGGQCGCDLCQADDNGNA